MIRQRMILSVFFLILVYVMGACFHPAETPAPEANTPVPSETGTPVAAVTPQPTGESNVNPDAEVAAMVNGQPIGRMEFERQVARFQAAMITQGYNFSGEEGGETARQVRKQVLEAMIDQVLIEQAAAAQGITVDEDVLQQRIQNDIELGGGQEKFEEWLKKNALTMDEYVQMTRSTILTEEMLRRLEKDVPDTMKQVHLRQILVTSEADAQNLRQQLDAGADFAELAKKYSMDEGSRSLGGDRGYLPLGTGVLPPELEAAVADLAPGEIAGPIASGPGYYLVMVVDVDENRAVPAEMRQGLTQERFVDWIQAQRMQATIERFVDFGG